MKKCMDMGKKKMEMREMSVKMPAKMSMMKKEMPMPKKMAAGGIGKVRKGVY